MRSLFHANTFTAIAELGFINFSALSSVEFSQTILLGVLYTTTSKKSSACQQVIIDNLQGVQLVKGVKRSIWSSKSHSSDQPNNGSVSIRHMRSWCLQTATQQSFRN